MADLVDCERLQRDVLARSEHDLAALFGLLVHAHYRTTPSDLERLLDAPNLAVHVARVRAGGAIVAANLVALEGGLPADLCDDLLRGRARVRAHALADALVAHLGRGAAGRLSMLRSVRIAVHPALRRYGLARRLCQHVHASYAVDLYGTLFGATPEIIRFRRDLGYEVVRLSASRGARSGEPSVMMVRAASPAAAALVVELRSELAQALPLQLALLANELVLEPALVEGLHAGLPPPPETDEAACARVVRAYLEGPRTVESVAFAVRRVMEAHPQALEALAPAQRRLLEGRLLRLRSWPEAAREAGLVGPAAAMRAMRPAVAALARALDR